MILVDTHAHLNFKAFAKDYLDVALRSRVEGVVSLVIPGSNVETSEKAVLVCTNINKELGENFASVAVGIHPIHSDEIGEFPMIEDLSRDNIVVAIGEAGMDRYHLNNEEEIIKQKKLFREHIDLALEIEKPLIVHNREADEDVLGVLKTYSKLPKMVFHCFSSDWGFAQEILVLGAFISFTGNITYGNKKIKKVIERVPLDRIMLDSDSPYLVPEPLRSEDTSRNEPQYIIEIAKKIANVRNISLEEVCSQTTKNAKTFFSI